MRYSFTIPGNPKPKERPRTVRKNGKVMTFTPKATMKAEAIIADNARMAGVQLTSEPLHLTVRFYRENAVACDLDNLVKTVQDALNRVAYCDDKQIEMLTATKAIDRNNPRTEVEIEELPPVGVTALDEALGSNC